MKEIQLGVIGRRFDALEKLLEGKQFIAGDKFTVADAYLFTVTRWAPFVDLDLSRLANLTAFMDTIATRASVREAMKVEGLTHARQAA